MQVSDQQLKAFLVDRRLIKKDVIEKAEKISKTTGKSLEDVVLDESLVSEKELIRLKAYILGIPFIDLRKLDIDSETLRVIPESIARKNNIVAFKKKEEDKDLKKAAQELPIIKIVDTLIKHAILQRASDIHVEPGEKEVVVRYRIDSVLHDAMILPKQVHVGIVARIKVLSNLKLDEHRLPQDGRFKIETKDEKISFRVSILPTFFGEKVVMRLLLEDGKKFTLESLGFWGKGLEIIHSAIKKPYGMILATGPTGCGKTTPLYTILEILNQPGF